MVQLLAARGETFDFEEELESFSSMWTFETPPLSHKLRKGYVCFKSGGKAGRGGSLLLLAEKTDALKVGRYPDLHPAATTGFLCSLAHITQVDTWNGHSQFSKELWQLPSKWILEHLSVPTPGSPPKIPSAIPLNTGRSTAPEVILHMCCFGRSLNPFTK